MSDDNKDSSVVIGSGQQSEVTFNPKLEASQLSQLLSEAFGIDPAGMNKGQIIKALKKEGAKPKEEILHNLEDAQMGISDSIEESAKTVKEGGESFVDVIEPSVVRILVGEDPAAPSNDDFTAKLNGKTYQIKRNTEVDVPYGLVADLMKQKILKPIEVEIEGKTKSITIEKQAYTYISVINMAVKTRKRRMAKELYDALREKGELA